MPRNPLYRDLSADQKAVYDDTYELLRLTFPKASGAALDSRAMECTLAAGPAQFAQVAANKQAQAEAKAPAKTPAKKKAK